MDADFEARMTSARARLEKADKALLQLLPSAGRAGIVHAFAKELYELLFTSSATVRSAIIEVLQARRDNHRAIGHGYAQPRDSDSTAAQDIHEWKAQLLDAVLAEVGDGRSLPAQRTFDDFEPEGWYPDTSAGT